MAGVTEPCRMAALAALARERHTARDGSADVGLCNPSAVAYHERFVITLPVAS